MDYFDKEANVQAYFEMTRDFDDPRPVEWLSSYLPQGSSVLELGMGPGKDFNLLRKHYNAAGTDKSSLFVDAYLKEHPEADVFVLDALTLDTRRKFDALFSNKVLIHLSSKELAASARRQQNLLSPGGIILHTFWRGSGSEEMEGLHFQYYEQNDLRALFNPYFEILDVKTYDEMEQDDSLCLIARYSVKKH